MPVADAIREAMTRASWIRTMFERGADLERQHGADAVVDFTLGNPMLAPPAPFFDALAKLAQARDGNNHRYMPNAGFPEVRARIAEHLNAAGTLEGLDETGVIMTVGAGGGLNATLKTILNPDDEVVILAPYFVEYMFYIRNHGGVPVISETDATFDVDAEAIARVITPKTKAIIINTPNNPTGRLYPRASLDGLVQMLAAKEKEIGHPIYLVADEPYRDLVYVDDPPPTPAALHPNSFLVFSWSKSLSIPGERIGYVAINPRIDAPSEIATAVTFANRTLGFVNAPATMQLIVGEILSVTVDVEWYRRKRDRIVEGLQSAGYELIPPEGAFYVFPRSPDPDDVAFVNRAIESRVLLVPGSGFGRKGFFRLAYCVDDDTVDRGIEALAKLAR